MNKRMCGPSFETPRKDARLLRMTRHVAAYWLAIAELSIGDDPGLDASEPEWKQLELPFSSSPSIISSDDQPKADDTLY